MYSFRVANSLDIPNLSKLLNELFSLEKEFIPNETLQKKALETIINDEKIGNILVCTYENRVVAMVNLLYSFSTALGSRVVILEDMIVSNEYRDKNIGSKLLEFAKEFAKSKGIERITLLTDDDNFKAHKFYEKNGFKKSSMVVFRTFLNE
ncbi:MAG: GNAT family N-acetyltransferase [Arcobacter sp.]|jgi:GNAT superfamily N-acetyltransferase|uniref:GNAT family N-acetyltransferase n=1 Tax=Arcobacter sp. TaxID=1872629 RepID=UPI0019C9AAF8|nr:GNAT family N-acetyltransferase [Arcobacter sp.]MBD3830569.1 GNAT family N-acetyltransferase [Arcobacter sp.]MDD3009296.1 GNAT family N-acetyltransferase [Arcobacter sp.]